METLESLLLEAAGRRGSPSRKKQKAYVDDGSDVDDSSSDGLGYTTVRRSASSAPLKKRLGSTERDDDEDGMEDEDEDHNLDSDESVGSDLYKGESDREELARMTELEREMILSERAQIRDDEKLTEKWKQRSGKKKQDGKREPSETPTKQAVNKEPQETPTSRVRSSARNAERGAAKDEILNELRAKRLKHSVALMAPKSSDSSQSENQRETQSPIRKEKSVSEEEEDEDGSSQNEERQTLEDISEITIKRSQLAKWFREPFFEELIVGCFVRGKIGMKENVPCYKLCVVKNVDSTKSNSPYKLDNKSTNKYLNVIWGRYEHKWEMSVISDSLPLEMEFIEWEAAMKRDEVQMPTRKEIEEKKAAIQNPSATAKQMLEKKSLTSSRPLTIAAEKARLRTEMDVAESKKDMVEVERIKARLSELELARKTQEKDSKALKLSEMNKRNRADNFKKASELKRVDASLKAGQEGYDPFSRRWTRSRNYYESKPEVEASEIDDKAGQGGARVEVVAKVGKLVDTKAPVDQATDLNRKHNFELPISLAELQRFGGANGAFLGYMARKSKIEAKIGRKVPEVDGRKHVLTLTVSDYKRRRGLL
ncbi:hypothetical protein ACHQM5_006074 [Ranunculus cassubicifolius]